MTNKTTAVVDLPHDATIGTKRTTDDHTYFLNVGFHGSHCIYQKTLFIPEEYRAMALYLEFEGIYRDFTVTLNGHELLNESFGYIPYAVRIEDFVLYGKDNVLKVEIDTPFDNHNRWYAGTGIYQDVYLHVAPKEHIRLHGVRVTTISHEQPRVLVETAVAIGSTILPGADSSTETGRLAAAATAKDTDTQIHIEILDGDKVVATADGTRAELEIPDARLWDAAHPYLYTARVTLTKDGQPLDTAMQTFGIRTLAWNAEQGFLVNGVRTLLKGGCIHNDNGVIGMVANRVTEERRVKNLKASGFNALRSAHHPMSPALLEMCDKYGMYVMDESFDTWYRMKQINGFHLRFMEFYEDVTARMVRKDYNHPCVIMYSIGNEINEIGSLKGVRVARRMMEIIRSLDATRPLTLCPSMKMARNFLADTPYAEMDEDEYMAQGAEYEKKDADHYVWLYTKAITNIPGSAADPYPKWVQEADEAATFPLYKDLEIAGYNYYSDKFDDLHALHPERVLLGTETRGHLIYDNWNYIKKHPYAIGDFIWTLQDHIGEANVSGRHYENEEVLEDAASFCKGRGYPWLLNDGGVVDLLGHTLPAIHKFRLCWEEEHGIYLASQPPVHDGVAATYGCYKWTDTIDSWSYDGCEGRPTFVDVYSDAAEVEVLINGKSLGRKAPLEFFAKFPCTYEPGELTGIGFNEAGEEIYRTTLHSAGSETRIRVTPDKTVLKADTQDFCFLNIDVTDENGTIKAWPERELTIAVEGAATLQGFGSAECVTAESYCDNVHTTCNGRALAVLRSANAPGDVTVTVGCDGLPEAIVHLTAKA